MHNHAQPCTTTRWFLLTCLMICCLNFVSAQHQSHYESSQEFFKNEIQKASHIFEASCIESYIDTTESIHPVVVAKYQIHKIFKGNISTEVITITYDGQTKTHVDYRNCRKNEQTYEAKAVPVGVTSMFIFSENDDFGNKTKKILSVKSGQTKLGLPLNYESLLYYWTALPGTHWHLYPDAIYYNNSIGKGNFKHVNDLYDLILLTEGASRKDITLENIERPLSYSKWKAQQNLQSKPEKKKLPTNTKTKH